MKKIIPLLLILALAANSFAATGGAAFLRKGVGARALAMGGAYTSLSNDTTAVYWNPAGLAINQDYSVTIMGSSGASNDYDGLSDILPTHNFFAFSVPFNKFSDFLGNSVFAFGLLNSTADNITHSDEQGNVYNPFKDSSNAFYLSWGIPVWEDNTNLYCGASFKFITESMDGIDGGSGLGYDIDAGVIYNVFETLNFGLFLQKGAAMSWDGGSDNAPLLARFGVSNAFSVGEKFELIGSADIVQAQEEPVGANLGAEFSYIYDYDGYTLGLGGVHLRAGVNGWALENRHGAKSYINENVAFCAGFGIDVIIMGKYLQLDYAFSTGNTFDNQSKFSLNFYF